MIEIYCVNLNNSKSICIADFKFSGLRNLLSIFSFHPQKIFFLDNVFFYCFRSFLHSIRCNSHVTLYPPKKFTVIFWKQINFALSQGCVFRVIRSFSQFNLFSFLIRCMRYYSLLFRFFRSIILFRYFSGFFSAYAPLFFSLLFAWYSFFVLYSSIFVFIRFIRNKDRKWAKL